MVYENSAYHHYRSLIKQVYDGDGKLSNDELADEIYEAYSEGRLSGREYDNLCSLMDEL